MSSTAGDAKNLPQNVAMTVKITVRVEIHSDIFNSMTASSLVVVVGVLLSCVSSHLIRSSSIELTKY